MTSVRLASLGAKDAQLARVALAELGIQIEVVGEQLFVDSEQLERARHALTLHLSTVAKECAPVRCFSCRALNLARLSTCWSCQASLAKAESATPVPEAPAGAGSTLFTGLFVILTIILAVLLYEAKQPVRHRSQDDSCVTDSIKGVKAARWCDFDGDGAFEQSEAFDRKGRLHTRFFDANQDGAFERADTFDSNGMLMARAFDLDDDWRFDRFEDYDAKEKLQRRSIGDLRSVRGDIFDEAGNVT